MANDPLSIQPQNLNPFDRLPEAVRDWLNSTEVLMTLISIEEQFSIRTENIPVIPFIITGLVTDKIEPAKFVYALEVGLKIPNKDAGTIAGIIKNKILNPIAGPLKLTTNIDISAIPAASTPAPASIFGLSRPPSSATPLSAPTQNQNAQAPAKPLIPGTNVTPSAAPKPFLNQTVPPSAIKAPLTPPTIPSIQTSSLLKPSAPTTGPSLPPPSEKKLGEQASLGPAPVISAEKPMSEAVRDIRPAMPAAKPQQLIDAQKPAPKTEKSPSPAAPGAPSISSGQATTKTGPKPFMLHEEKPTIPSMTQRQSFSFSVPSVPKPISAAAKPVEAQFGSAFENFGKKPTLAAPETARTEDQKPKIVHYSAFRTLVDPATGLPAAPKKDTPAQ